MSLVETPLDSSGLSLQDMEDKENSMICDDGHHSLKFSDILFTDDQGLGLRFTMKPCPERRETRIMVERGGGHMVSRNFRQDCINLATVSQLMNDTQAFDFQCHFMAYILDCCLANELKDLNAYKVIMPLTRPDKATQQKKTQTEITESNASDEPSVEHSKQTNQTQTVEPDEDISIEPLIIDEDNANNSDTEIEEDIDDNSESEETVSRYFKASKKKRTPPQTGHFTDYLRFLKDREQANTPENLRRIKEAFKGLKKQTEDKNKDTETKSKAQKAKASHYSLRPKKTDKSAKKAFGEKIVDKLAEESNKSFDDGYKVSDISSDDSFTRLSSAKKTKFVNKRKVTPTKIVPKQSNLYTLDEDVAILDYVIKTGRFDELKGNALWEEAQKKKVLAGRSWQSMKERFRKHIIANVESFDIEPKYKKLLQKNYYTERPRERQTLSHNTQTGFYTVEEDMEIINHVIKRNGYDLVKGNAFWTEMETKFKDKKVCARTWQSLKERYSKRIVPNLHNYDIRIEVAQKMLSTVSGLTDDQKKVILNKLEKKSMNLSKKSTNKKKN